MKREPEPMTEGTLLDMLTYQRRGRGAGESMFIDRYLAGYTEDAYGNFRVEVDPRETTTLFSCHTDSVHPTGGKRQCVAVDSARNEVFKEDRHALGADDAVGVWLLLHMIHQGVPGVYVFHRDEETGGNGSSWIAEHDARFLGRFQRAVAFDRRGTGDVITHQLGARCCSDTFASALAAALGGSYQPSPEGVFTDTAMYDTVIPECTNLSVGYYNEHSKHETLDLTHAGYLLDTVCDVDWERLPTLRDPDAYVQAEPANDPWRRAWHMDSGWQPAAPVSFKDEADALDYVMNNPQDAAELLAAAYPIIDDGDY